MHFSWGYWPERQVMGYSQRTASKESPSGKCFHAPNSKANPKERKWPSQHIWKEHVFILPSLFQSVVETRCIIYGPTGLLNALRIFLKIVVFFYSFKIHSWIFPFKRSEINNICTMCHFLRLYYLAVILNILQHFLWLIIIAPK